MSEGTRRRRRPRATSRRAAASVSRAAARTRTEASQAIVEEPEASLLDIVDNVLSKGVVVSGDITIALAQVDLIYARLSLLLCAADRVLPHEDGELMARHHTRLTARGRTGRQA